MKTYLPWLKVSLTLTILENVIPPVFKIPLIGVNLLGFGFRNH